MGGASMEVVGRELYQSIQRVKYMIAATTRKLAVTHRATTPGLDRLRRKA
jgi:hypothetical protein